MRHIAQYPALLICRRPTIFAFRSELSDGGRSYPIGSLRASKHATTMLGWHASLIRSGSFLCSKTPIRSMPRIRWLGHGSRTVRQRSLAIPVDCRPRDASRRLPTVLSVAKVTSDGLEYRKAQTWQAQTTLLLTQPGFPEGRALFPNAEEEGVRSKYSYTDPGRFTSLTALYSQFAQSDEVRALSDAKARLADRRFRQPR